MAPRKRKRKPVSAPPDPGQDDVAAAVVHLGRLAASHSRWGVEFTTGIAEADDYPIDEASLVTLREVTELLLADRKRMWGRNTDVLKHRLHEATTKVYSAAQNNAEIEENVEELVDRFARAIGFALGTEQLKRFAVDAQHIKKRTASQAAAEALLDGIKGHRMPTTAGRSIFDAKERQETRAPIPAPMHRYAPLRTVRRYFEHAVDVVEAQRMPDALLALGALPSDARVLPPDAPVEAIQQRVEALFKKRLSVDLEKEGYETFRKFLLALLHGEDPAAGRTLAPEIEKQLALAREQFRALATGLLYLADGDSAVLERKADEGAEWLIAKLKGALDAE